MGGCKCEPKSAQGKEPKTKLRQVCRQWKVREDRVTSGGEYGKKLPEKGKTVPRHLRMEMHR